MISVAQPSSFHYLFRKEAAEVYDLSVASDEFLNQSLDALMRVNVHFLSKQENDGIPFLDPAAFNNQCHLYSLFVVKLMRGYKARTDDEKLARTEENRFLHLTFILSYTFLKERTLLCDVIAKIAEIAEIALPEPHEKFFRFIKDSLPGRQGALIRTARLALNALFECCIKQTFTANRERSPLHRELYLMAHEPLQHLSDGGNSPLSLYTLPKVAGVAFLIQESLPMLFKVKVITPEGTGTLICQSGPVGEDEPLLVVEGISSSTHSIDDFRRVAVRCPSYFEREVSQKNRHREDQRCHFCNPAQIDLTAARTHFTRVMQNVPETLYILGADFVSEVQPGFRGYFNDFTKYPLLSEIFQRAVTKLKQSGLEAAQPFAFTVDHVYVDRMHPELRMNYSPRSFLQSRGYL